MTDTPTAPEALANRWFGLRVEYETPRTPIWAVITGALVEIASFGFLGPGFSKGNPMPHGFADVVVYRKDTGLAVNVVAFPMLLQAHERIARIETLLETAPPDVMCNELGIPTDTISGPGTDPEVWETTVEWIPTKHRARRR